MGLPVALVGPYCIQLQECNGISHMQFAIVDQNGDVVATRATLLDAAKCAIKLVTDTGGSDHE